MVSLTDVKKLGIIAGGGHLPKHVYDSARKLKIPVVVIGLEHETDFEVFDGVELKIFPVHKISKILKCLKDCEISHVTLAGKVKRADLKRLLLDIKGAKLFTQIMKSGLADNSILQTIIKFVEKEGFAIIAPEKIAGNIVLNKGVLTKSKPSKEAMNDIKKGLKVLKGIADYDVGQALVIQNGLVLGVEAAEGTDDLIRRCGEIKQCGDIGPILIKVSKPSQDRRVDLPCIGLGTIENALLYGYQGIAAESGSALALEQEAALRLANNHKFFIVGI
jgi:DUF1009 family protein